MSTAQGSSGRVAYCAGCGRVMVPAAAAPFSERALKAIAPTLGGCYVTCWRFFETIFRTVDDATSANHVARSLGIGPSTLNSRFWREGLPSPKRYFAFARLARAADLMEQPERTVSWTALTMNASSAQSFNRFIRLQTGLTAAAFRRQFTGEQMVERFRRELVLPYQPTLLTFVLVPSIRTAPLWRRAAAVSGQRAQGAA